MNQYGITTKTERCALPHGAFDAEIGQLEEVRTLRLCTTEAIRTCIGDICEVPSEMLELSDVQVLEICKALQPILNKIACDGKGDLKIVYPNIQNRVYYKRLK